MLPHMPLSSRSVDGEFGAVPSGERTPLPLPFPAVVVAVAVVIVAVLADRGGVARSAVAAFVPRRPVCLETRGMQKRALPGLHL